MGEHKPKHSAGKPDPSLLTEHAIVGSEVRKGGTPKRKVTSLILIAIIVIAIGGGGFLMYRKQQASRIYTVCSDENAKEAHSLNEMQSVSGLEKLAAQIKSRKNYAKDPNCLYIVAQSQIVASDITGAQTTIDQLKKKYADFHFNQYLDSGKASLQNLQSQFDVMKETEENSRGRFVPDI